MRHLFAFLMAIMGASKAGAAVVEYGTTQREQWFADIGGPENVSTVDFTGYSDFTPITDQWAHLGIHFSGFVVTSGFDDIAFPNDGWGVRGEPDINVTFDEPINWIAADFPGQTTIAVYSNDLLLYTTSLVGGGGPGHFGGLISDIAFDRLRFFEEDNFVDALDNIYFGLPIPAPGTLVMLLFAGGAFVRRRRR